MLRTGEVSGGAVSQARESTGAVARTTLHDRWQKCQMGTLANRWSRPVHGLEGWRREIFRRQRPAALGVSLVPGSNRSRWSRLPLVSSWVHL